MFNISKFIDKPKIIYTLALEISKQHDMKSFMTIILFSELQILFLIIELIYSNFEDITKYSHYFDIPLYNIAMIFNLRHKSGILYLLSIDKVRYFFVTFFGFYLLIPILIYLYAFILKKTKKEFINSWTYYFKMSHPWVISFYIFSWFAENIKFLLILIIYDDNDYNNLKLKYIVELIIISILICLNILFSGILYVIFMPLFKESDSSGIKFSCCSISGLVFKIFGLILLTLPQNPYKKIFIIVFLVIWVIIQEYHLFYHLPFYSLNLMTKIIKLHAICCGIITAKYLTILLTFIDESFAACYSLSLFILCSLLIKAYENIVKNQIHKYLFITKNLTEAQTITKIILVEEYLNFPVQKEDCFRKILKKEIFLNVVVTNHIQNCIQCSKYLNQVTKIVNFNDNFFELKTHIIEKMLVDALEKYPKSFPLNSMFIHFLLELRENAPKACFIIEKLNSYQENFAIKLFSYALSIRIQNKLETEAKHTIIRDKPIFVNFRENEIMFDKLSNTLFQATDLCISFWNQIQANIPNLSKMLNLATKVKKYFKKIAHMWESYKYQIPPNFARVWLIYGIFLCWVKNKPEAGKFFLKIYRDITIKYDIYDYVNNIDDKTIYLSRSISILVNIHKEKLGEIISCSDSIETLVDYSPSYLINKNLNEILPEFMREYHTTFMNVYNQRGRGTALNIPRDQFVLHKKGYIISTNVVVALFPFIHNHVALIGIIRENKTKEPCDYIITSENGDILASTKAVFFEHNLHKLNSKKIPLTQLLMIKNINNFHRLQDNSYSKNMDTTSMKTKTQSNLQGKESSLFNLNDIKKRYPIRNYYNTIMMKKSLSFDIQIRKAMEFCQLAEDLEQKPYEIPIYRYRKTNNSIKRALAALNHSEKINYEVSCMTKSYGNGTLVVKLFKLKRIGKIKPPNLARYQNHPTIPESIFTSNNNDNSDHILEEKKRSYEESKDKIICDTILDDCEIKFSDSNQYFNMDLGIEGLVKKPYEGTLFTSKETERRITSDKNENEGFLISFPSNTHIDKHFNIDHILENNVNYDIQNCNNNEKILVDRTKNKNNSSSSDSNDGLQSDESEEGRSNLSIDINLILKLGKDLISSKMSNNTANIHKTLMHYTHKNERDKIYRDVEQILLARKESKLLTIQFWLGIILSLYIFISLFGIEYQEDFSNEYIIQDLNITAYIQNELISLIELDKYSRLLWLYHKNLTIDDRMKLDLYNNISNNTDYMDYLMQKIYKSGEYLLENSSNILDGITNSHKQSNTFYFDMLSSLYDIDSNGNKVHNSIEIPSYDTSNIIYMMINDLMKYYHSSNGGKDNQKFEVLLNRLLYNVLNDIFIAYEINLTLIKQDLIYIITVFTNKLILYLYIVIPLTAFIILVMVYILINLYIAKKTLLINIIGINPEICESYVKRLKIFLQAIEYRWNDDKLIKIGKESSFNICKDIKSTKKSKSKINRKEPNKSGLIKPLIYFFLLSLLSNIILTAIISFRVFIANNHENNIKKYISTNEYFHNEIINQELSLAILYEYISENISTTVKNEPIDHAFNDTLKSISNYQQFFSTLKNSALMNNDKPLIEYALIGNMCNILPFESNEICTSLGGGPAMKGITTINVYIHEVIKSSKLNFDNSNKLLEDMRLNLDRKDIKDLEVMFSYVFTPCYNYLDDLLYNDFVNATINNNKIRLLWLIISLSLIFLNIFGILIPIKMMLMKQKLGLKQLLLMIPKSVIVESNFMQKMNNNNKKETKNANELIQYNN